MEHVGHWTVDIFLDEHDVATHARAQLLTNDGKVVGLGEARRNPRDLDVPEIGSELAVARALADLSHKLLDATVDDIETITRRPTTAVT